MHMKNIFQFYGGIHPLESKMARGAPICLAPLLPRYVVPLSMHIGAPAKPVVKVKDKVLKGQLIAEPGGFVSAAIHSPTSGTIKEFTTCITPTNPTQPCVVIEADGEDKAAEPLAPFADWRDADPAALLKRVGEAGIVGMGGAGFPAAVKLSIPPNKSVDTLIINGVECEPCLTADHRLMLECAEKAIEGIGIAARILGVSNIVFVIEDNKADAIQHIRELLPKANTPTPIHLATPRVRYPQGAEKQLIYTVTQRQVPHGGLPVDVHCVVHNVATLLAIAEAVVDGKPLYERTTTVTGRPVVSPANWRFRVGTTYTEAIRLSGGTRGEVGKVISGGPMMGFTVYSTEVPVMKNTSGITLLSPEEVVQFTSRECLRCGRCNDVCPMMLMPGILSAQIENERFTDAEEWNVMDCIECGCCTFVCPSRRPLVQHMRRAKAEVGARLKARAAAAKAAEAAKKN